METRAERAERMRAHAVDQFNRHYGQSSNSAQLLATASNVRHVQVGDVYYVCFLFYCAFLHQCSMFFLFDFSS